jgi:hypothetical protein
MVGVWVCEQARSSGREAWRRRPMQQSFDTVLNLVALAVTIAAFAVSGFSIWLAWKFYDSGRTVQSDVHAKITEIDRLVSALGTVTERHFGKLLDHAIAPRPELEHLFSLISTPSADPTAANRSSPQKSGEVDLARLLIIGATFAALSFFCIAEHDADSGPDHSTKRQVLDQVRAYGQRMLAAVDSLPPKALSEELQGILGRAKRLFQNPAIQKLIDAG